MLRRPAPKGEADLGLHGDLHDAGHLVFDRIFDGDDAAMRLIEIGEEGVERRRFATAGGAGDEDDAVGQFQQFIDDRTNVVREAEAVHGDLLLR
jgi:hypothetical protein